jgi:hypothetical protein
MSTYSPSKLTDSILARHNGLELWSGPLVCSSFSLWKGFNVYITTGARVHVPVALAASS